MSADHEQPARFRPFLRAAYPDILLWLALLGCLMVSLAAAATKARFAPLLESVAACVQIGVVAIFFMQLRRARALILLTCASAFLFLIVMFGLTLTDLFTRL